MTLARLRSTSVTIGAIAIFLCGAVGVPTLHQAFHHADHIHVGDSIIFLHEDHDDDHDADHHHDDVAGDDDHDDDDHDHHHDADHDDHHHHDEADHGATSLFHFGAALGHQLSVLPALPALRIVARVAPCAEAHACLLAPLVPHLRGPPAR